MYGYLVSEIEDARLAAVLHLCAGVADLRLLVPRTSAWAPTEQGEGTNADLAFFAESSLLHPYEAVARVA